MSSSRSICGGCSRGCNVFLDHLNDTTYRIRPRENEAVNQEWMCDDGRLTYKGMNRGRALTVRAGKEARDTPPALAVSKAASLLLEAAKAKKLLVLVSPQASLEDQLLALKVVRLGLEVGTVYVGGRAEGWKDDLLKRSDENPNRRGLTLAAQALGVELSPFEELLAKAASGAFTALWAVGTELPVDGAVEKLSGLAIVAQAVNGGGLSEVAEVVLPSAPISEADGTFVNFEGRAQRFERAYSPRGQSRPHWAWAQEIALALGQPSRFASAREVFLAFSAKLEPALGDFQWDSLPRRRPGSPSGFAGTVDGRLAGFREVEQVEGLKDLPALATGSEEGRP